MSEKNYLGYVSFISCLIFYLVTHVQVNFFFFCGMSLIWGEHRGDEYTKEGQYQSDTAKLRENDLHCSACAK